MSVIPRSRIPVLFGGVTAAGNGLLTNLIAYWKLDEAGGANDALDAHTGGLTLTQDHSPGSMAGVIGTARTFDGSNDFFTRADDASLSTGDIDFTISAWVYLAVTNANSTIIARYTAAGDNREYGLYYNNDDHAPNQRFSFVVSADGAAATATINATTFGAPSATTWYHVVVWHDAANNLLGISVNDTADTAAYAGGVFNSAAATVIGKLTGIYSMNGSIDEVGFWKCVLTDAQRTALYNSGNGLAYGSFTA